MAARIEITGSQELRKFAAQLSQVPTVMRRQLQTRMRGAAEPMKAAVQRSALAIPARGPGTGLRREIAAATRVRVTTTPTDVIVRIYIDPNAMPPGKEALPSLMEGPGWTHPIYGRGRTFQRGHSYFKSAVTQSMPAMRSAINSAADNAFRTIR